MGGTSWLRREGEGRREGGGRGKRTDRDSLEVPVYWGLLGVY